MWHQYEKNAIIRVDIKFSTVKISTEKSPEIIIKRVFNVKFEKWKCWSLDSEGTSGPITLTVVMPNENIKLASKTIKQPKRWF